MLQWLTKSSMISPCPPRFSHFCKFCFSPAITQQTEFCFSFEPAHLLISDMNYLQLNWIFKSSYLEQVISLKYKYFEVSLDLDGNYKLKSCLLIFPCVIKYHWNKHFLNEGQKHISLCQAFLFNISLHIYLKLL